jgi:predicted transcriptional regulator
MTRNERRLLDEWIHKWWKLADECAMASDESKKLDHIAKRSNQEQCRNGVLEMRIAQLEASKAQADAILNWTRDALKAALERDWRRKHPLFKCTWGPGWYLAPVRD